MKLPIRLLKNFIDVPVASLNEIRVFLDEAGLEVKSSEGEGENSLFTIETLANRGDHASVLGVARELAARLALSMKMPPLGDGLTSNKLSLPVRRTTNLCSAYALLELVLQDSLPPHPDVTAILGASDRPALVDIANFVQLECGQPLHVFDRDKVEGEVSVCELAMDESVVALDGKSYTVPAGSIVIRDRAKVIAVAGVIGCANSMADTTTRRVLVESAAFDPVRVRLTARAMGLATDASFIFERGSDRGMIISALRRLFFLAKQGGGGNIKDIGFALLEGTPPERRTISVDLRKVRLHTNLARLPELEVTSRLKYLGYNIEKSTPSEITVAVPTWRLWDVFREEDLIEDIIRSLGLNRVKAVLPAMEPVVPEESEYDTLQHEIEPYVLGAGFIEVITSAFYAERDIQLLESLERGLGSRHVRIKNAIESDYSGLRVTPILHLGDVANWNVARGATTVKVFEYTTLFSDIPLSAGSCPPRQATPEVTTAASTSSGESVEEKYERTVLALLSVGPWEENCFSSHESVSSQILHLKGLVEAIGDALGAPLAVTPSSISILHPGIQGRIMARRKEVGFIGQLHPRIGEKRRWKRLPVYAELDLSLLAGIRTRCAAPKVSPFPEMRRDITLKIGAKEPASRVVRIIEELELRALQKAEIVSQFSREEENFRRITYRLTFQELDRTLAKEEVDGEMERLIATLRTKHRIDLLT